MMLMCGNSNQLWHYWAGRFPGKVGHLFGPKNMAKQALRKWMPFACDNDAFIAWTNKAEWNEAAWLGMLDRVRLTGLSPLWVLVPDVVADREATLAAWGQYAPHAARAGWPLAFAAQDGMEPDDVPAGADVVFVGGSTEWKWRTVPMWAAHFPRVHVGRVNEVHRLVTCERLGIESVDGSGWFRDTASGRRMPALERWMEGTLEKHPEFAL